MISELTFSTRMIIFAATLFVWLVIFLMINRRHVDVQRRLDLGTSLDKRIPFRPWFALLYFSTYLFVFLPFIILSVEREFYWMLASFASITAVSSLIHTIIPSKIERVETIDGGGTGWMLQLFQRLIKPHGNFPSMHVGLSVPVVVSFFLSCGPIAGGISALWAIMIALSTLFTKQHYILDVLVGLANGVMISALLFLLIMA